MARWFNTAGPCKPGYHYMLPPARRIPQVRGIIDQMQSFVHHAPRQTREVTIIYARRALAAPQRTAMACGRAHREKCRESRHCRRRRARR
ncbi:MAG TPA: hypothetical protein VF469_05975 [Kofleriaceae bacterium]